MHIISGGGALERDGVERKKYRESERERECERERGERGWRTQERRRDSVQQT